MKNLVDELSISKTNSWHSAKNDLYIKNGRVVYLEERLLTENHKQVNQAIVKFRDWRAQFESKNTSVSASDIPQIYTDLIALLAHESEENLKELSQRINHILSPFGRNKELSIEFTDVIQQIIKVTAYQERYGLADVILLLKGAPSSIPKRLSIYRWQAHDITRFPTDIVQAFIKQREERKLFSRLFTNAFQQLSSEEKLHLLFHETGNLFAGTKGNSTKNNTYSPPPQRKKRKEDDELSSLFTGFQSKEHVILTTTEPRKRLCSSFDTLFYVGLNNTFDLRQRFLDDLSSESKRKRGVVTPSTDIDLKHAWLTSTITPKIRSLKMKLLLFHEDVRPAYYGTWTKPLGKVTGKKPFNKDTQLDYEYDSEAEWDHDVEGDDIHTLDEGDGLSFYSSEEEEEEEEANDDDTDNKTEEEEEEKWVVPEGYLSDDEGTYKKQPKHHRGIVSRPAKWPISANKHFPMKSVILGPLFDSIDEPDNHPLSDFKMHMFVELPWSPFDITSDNSGPIEIDTSYQREIDKVVNSYKKELMGIVLDNKTKTMMGLVTVLKSTKTFCEFTTAQLQAMIHDVAVQEMRGANKEYHWYLRTAASTLTA